MSNKANAVKMKDNDNVATAVRDLSKGEKGRVKINQGEMAEVDLLDDIPFGHKFALLDIPKGASVIKYGEEIGIATQDIHCGEHVHIHNVDSVRGKGTAQGA
ncbi:altronate dehydratase small subunit [Caldalkalibacillus uzonensis]|uniref:Altronate dehydratase small subunit n=1 Tax=Caldalkalibacillus uzonensis TaxID=353224 RepID=A0ABU0CPH0_9BACI|nr:UxaA family hydrolase [Caldalkalibacillus uzonensis]MDQ0338300.1 altronate dehydratase small subunit [Caldalkalibacillus uzonensis]